MLRRGKRHEVEMEATKDRSKRLLPLLLGLCFSLTELRTEAHELVYHVVCANKISNTLM